MTDTILNTTSTASVLATNGTNHTSVIDTAGDQDWWSVSLTAGTIYQFRLSGSGSPALTDPYLRLMNSAGNTVLRADDNAGDGLGSLITYVPASSGTYYLSAEAIGSYTGEYTLTATAVSASALAVNGSNHAGTISVAGETDWWSVALSANTLYQLRLNANGLADPYMSLMDTTGALIGADNDGGGSRNSLITYAPSSTGTYFLTAQGNGNYTGGYNFTATQLTPSALTANGNNHNGLVGLPGEVDWWAVTLTANTTYDLRLIGNGLADPYLRLMNASGTLITADDDAGGSKNSLITYTPTTTGTYYLATQGYANNIGDYILTATARAAAADTIPATIATGATLTLGAASTSTIATSTDQDWWGVTLTAGTTYDFTMAPDGGVAANLRLSDTYLRLLEADGDMISFNDDNGSSLNSLIRYTPGTSGTYFLSAQGFNGLTGAYSIRADIVPASADTIVATTATASSVAVGGSQTGTIDVAGDQDWWSVTLTAGNTYDFQLNGRLVDDPATGPVAEEIVGPSTLADPYLRLMNSAGGEIMANDDGGSGLNSLLTYTPTSDGTHYLSAGAFGNLTGNYRLSVTSRSADTDIAATTATTSTLAVDGTAGTSWIGRAGDNDWWKVSLTQGTQYRFQLDGVSLADPFLRLLDPTGMEIDSDDDSGAGLNSQIYYTAATTDVYFLSAQGYGANTGEYSLTAITDIAASAETSATVVVNGAAGSSAIGMIGDYDWWKVSLTSGTQYRFTLAGNGLADPFLALMSPTGLEIAYDNDSGAGLDAQITFTATTTGVHYLSAQGVGTGTGGYTLTAVTI